jgi:hypothetical protein
MSPPARPSSAPTTTTSAARRSCWSRSTRHRPTSAMTSAAASGPRWARPTIAAVDRRWTASRPRSPWPIPASAPSWRSPWTGTTRSSSISAAGCRTARDPTSRSSRWPGSTGGATGTRPPGQPAPRQPARGADPPASQCGTPR